MKKQEWVLLLRTPLQLVFIFWAYQYNNPVKSLFQSTSDPLFLDLPDAEIIYYPQFYDKPIADVILSYRQTCIKYATIMLCPTLVIIMETYFQPGTNYLELYDTSKRRNYHWYRYLAKS